MATSAVRTMMLSKSGTSSHLRLLLRGSLINASGNLAGDTLRISDLKTRPEPVSQYFGGVPSSGGHGGDAVVGFGLNSHGLHPDWRFGGFEEMGRVEARPRRRMVSEEDEEDDDEAEEGLDEDGDANFNMDFSDEDESDFDEEEEEGEEDEDDYPIENVRKRK